MFIGRKMELSFLEEKYKREDGQLIVLYGRRRVGKTETLKEFCKGKPHIFYSCRECTDRQQLLSYSEKVLKTGIPAAQYIHEFQDWESAFTSILELPGNGKKLLVIDEFPYMCKANETIPSILQNLWDSSLKDANIMIILCGSAMSFIEKEILAEKNPLYGRATGIYKMTEMPFSDVIKFFPNYTPMDQITVFAILGVMATSQGVGIEEVVSSGIGLAFIVFPKVFTVMGTWGTILGCLFFACLVFAGLTSCVSLVEAVSSAIIDKTGWERKKVVSYISIIGALLSATFATGAGLYILDIMDNFINCYGIVVVGLLEVIVIGWIVKPATIRNHTNKTSYFKIGKWWDFVVKFITPTMLLIMLISNFVAELKAPYGDYNLPELFAYGWSVVGLGIIGALLFSKAPWKNKEIENFNDEEEVA